MKCPICGYSRDGETPTGRFECPKCRKIVVYDSEKFEKYQREGLKLQDAFDSSLIDLTEEERVRMLDQRCLPAARIVANPEETLRTIRGRYQTIFDSSLTGVQWDNFDRALKIMAEAGWKLVAMSALRDPIGLFIYAVLERQDAKSDQRPSVEKRA